MDSAHNKLAAAFYRHRADGGSGIAPSIRAQTPSNGLIMLIEFEKIDGLHHWERELGQRGLTALIQAQNNVLTEYPDDFARLTAKGYTISGIDAEKPFWYVAYDEQLAACAG